MNPLAPTLKSTVQVDSESGKEPYVLRIYNDGLIFCSCPHFVHRLARFRGRERCKHIDRWLSENVDPDWRDAHIVNLAKPSRT